MLEASAASRVPFSVTSGPRVSRDVWWQLAEADESTTFFGTPEWSDVLVESFRPFHARPYLFQFGSGIRTLVPAIEVRRGLGRLNALHSMPFGTYGGFVGDTTPLGDEPGLSILAHLTADGWGRFQTTMFPNPLGRPLSPIAISGIDSVHVPDLSRGYEAWWQALDARTRYHIRKAERRGVEVRNDFSSSDFDAFTQLYLESARIWRPNTKLCPRFFRTLWEKQSPRIELWSANTVGPTGARRFCAGVLVFRFNRQVTPFLSAVDPEYRSLSPTNLIYQRLIRRSVTERSDAFSFLGSGGKPSIQRFKQSLGGKPVSFGYLNLPGPLYRWVRNPMSSVARRVGSAARVPRPPVEESVVSTAAEANPTSSSSGP